MARALLYMAVTPDEYELPLAVADSVVKLERITGVSRRTIYPELTRWGHGLKLGQRRGMRFIRIEIDESEAEK